MGKEITKAMRDTSASHNFISPEEAKRLGIKASDGRGLLKSVNSTTKPIQGIVHGVKVSIGYLDKEVGLLHHPHGRLPNYPGDGLFNQAKAFPMSFTNGLCIMEGDKACMVPMRRSTK